MEVFEAVHPLIGKEDAGKKLKRGAGGDISMQIDIVAENVIIDALKKENIDILLISEEIGEIYIGNESKANETGARLIVDPVDGSNNSVRGIPYCSVSIAYAEGETLEDIVMGLVIDLISKDIYFAKKGEGAFFNDQKMNVSEVGLDDDCIFELDYDFESLKENFVKYQEILKRIYCPRTMGSNALTFALIARGCIDGLFDFRKSSRLIDIAAGYLLIKEAGGNMFSKQGKNLDIKLSLDAYIPLVATNAVLEPQLKKLLIKINDKG